MSRIHGYNNDRVVSMTLDNAATCQITAVNGESERMPNDPNEPEVGFLVRVWEPWGNYPGEPKPDGEGYQDGTGHNLTCVSFVVRFTDEGSPVIDSLDVRSKHWRPDLAESEHQRRERANSVAEQNRRKLEEAERLVARAEELRAEVEGDG